MSDTTQAIKVYDVWKHPMVSNIIWIMEPDDGAALYAWGYKHDGEVILTVPDSNQTEKAGTINEALELLGAPGRVPGEG